MGCETLVSKKESPFIGRDKEFAILEDQFKVASGGNGKLVFISGEAGVGKADLVERFVKKKGKKIIYVTHLCSPEESKEPFYPFIKMFDAYYKGQKGAGPDTFKKWKKIIAEGSGAESFAKVRDRLCRPTSSDWAGLVAQVTRLPSLSASQASSL